MKIISITGGVGSGKCEVLRVMQEEFDAEIIKASIVVRFESFCKNFFV